MRRYLTMMMRVWLSALLLLVSGVARAQVAPNDACDQAIRIEGRGSFAFDSTHAHRDGSASTPCDTSSGIDDDVWFCWRAQCDGPVTVDTCDATAVNTSLAVYRGCACQPAGVDFLDCNDDTCSFQSVVTFNATAGDDYLIRIGSRPPFGGGPGLFYVRCGSEPVVECLAGDENPVVPSRWDALASNGWEFVVADNFVPETHGWVDQLCWWGAYDEWYGRCSVEDGDDFEVRYFTDVDGAPGFLRGGPFSQSAGSLVVSGPARTGRMVMDEFREYAYTATHPLVALAAGQCYWLEVRNQRTDGCGWYWSGADRATELVYQDDWRSPPGYDPGDRLAGDQAFVLNIPTVDVAACHRAPFNDECEEAETVWEGETPFDTTLATDSLSIDAPVAYCPAEAEQCCAQLLGRLGAMRDIWYEYTAHSDGELQVQVCDALFDTKVSVWPGDQCPTEDDHAMACSDDDCVEDYSLQSELTVFVEANETYLIRIGGYESTPRTDCLTERDEPGCDLETCELNVCDQDPTCCDWRWHQNCVALASGMCLGSSGIGTLVLDLLPPTPANLSLADFASFAACFTGPCPTSTCDPPMYADVGCTRFDYDGDGDVDFENHASLVIGLQGP